MELRKILIVEDSPPTREYLTELLQILGFHAHAVVQKTDFLTDLRNHEPDLVLLGSCNSSGQIKAFAEVIEREKKIPIVYIHEGGEISEARVTISDDSIGCLPGTFDPDDLKLAIDGMIAKCEEPDCSVLDDAIIGQSDAIKQIKSHIMRLCKSDTTVLITGESGTGKELVVESIHRLSPRSQNPFVKVNSAALPGTLLESELFGYEKGAFTGAWKKKPGKFVLAHSGSLLLDEIGEMPLSLQAKLLQVLENNNLDALGSTQSTEIDVRVFAVTNADLVQMVSDGRFRADLYYRLNVVAIHIPPLRERKEDIAVLTDHYFEKYAAHYRREKSGLDGYMQELFYQYSWPGNVRELANIIQSITVLGNEESFLCKLQNDSPLMSPHHSHSGVSMAAGSTLSVGKLGTTRSLKEVSKEAARKVETETILDVLTYTRWNRRKASELLGISYKALLNKIKEYQIEEQYRDTINKDTVHTNRQKRYQ